MVKPVSQRARHANQHLHPHHIRRKTAAVAVAACFTTGVAIANPTAPTVVHGTVSMNQAGSILNITNSHNAIINWGSFSIGVNELTRFIQPSALSAVLNRVVGSDPSTILGALQSNGRVFLLNPNGIVFGSGAQINVAGLVASTLNMSNEDFLNNRMRFTDGALAGSVVNQGSITGGNVYLIGNAVANKGLITSPNGEVVLAAGNSVELVSPGTPNLRVEVVAPANEAVNLGTISAEAGRVGIYAGLIRQGGTINADSAVAEGGRIMLKSTKSTVLEAGSLTTARGTSGGQIVALSDMTDGKTEVAGKLDASAIASGTPGAGGFIETSAAKVKIADSAVITAAGSGGGKAGTWLIDPTDFYISNAYGGDMTATLLSSTLGAYGSGTNVDVFSTSGLTGSSGTIFVNDAVTWSTDSTLRLIAVGGVDVNSAITNTGTGAVKLYSGWTGSFDGSSNPTIGFTMFPIPSINLNAPISTLGEIHLVAYGNIVQGAPGSLSANGLLASSVTGSVQLANASATNTVATIAGNAKGQFAFKNNGDLTIGSVGGVNGISAYGSSPGLHVTVDVNVIGGALTVANQIVAVGADGGEGQAGGNANISLSATNGITVNSSIVASAGHGGGSFFAFAPPPENGGIATINLTNTGSTSDIVINTGALVQANGGGGGDGYWNATPNGARGGDATVSITSARDVTIAGQVQAFGGHGGSGSSGIGGRAGDGIVSITATGGNLTVAAYGGVLAGGGSGGYGDSGDGGRAGDGVVTLTAGGNVTVSGTVRAYGGSGGSGSSGFGGRGGDAAVNVIAGGTLTVGSAYGGEIRAEGGEGGMGSWNGDGGRGGNASVNLTSTGPMILGHSSSPVTNVVTAYGGAGGRADGGEGFTGGDGGNGSIVALSGGGIEVSQGLNARGGQAFQNSGSGAASNFRGNGGGGSISLTNTDPGAYFAHPVGYYIEAEGGAGLRGGDASVTINTNTSMQINGVRAFGGVGSSMNSGSRRGGDAFVTLTSTSSTAPVMLVGDVLARGGDTNYNASVFGDGGDASVLITAAGGITQNRYVQAYAGGGYTGGRGGNALIQMTATGGTGLRVDGGETYATGGTGGFSGFGDAGAGGNAEIRLISSSGILLDAVDVTYKFIQARGGEGGGTNAVLTGGANGGAGGSGTVVIQNTSASSGVSINMNVVADGGEGGTGSFGFLSGTSLGGRGGDAGISISSASGVDVYSNGRISAVGGSGGQGSYRHMGSFSSPLGGVQSTGGRGGDASVTITAAGGVTVAGTQWIEAVGGDGGLGAFTEGYTGSGSIGYWSERSGNGGRGGNASMFIQSGNGFSLLENVYVNVRAGDGGGWSTGGLEVFGDGGNAALTINNTGAVPVNFGSFSSINVNGGDGTNGGDASIAITSAGGINTSVNTSIQAWGGDGVYGNIAGRGGAASIQLTSTSSSAGVTIDGGEVFASGGSGATNYAGASGRGGDASVSISSAGGILVRKFVGASAGDGGSNSSFGAGNGGNASVTFTNTSTTAPIAVIRDFSTAYGIVGAEGGWGLTGGNAAIAMTSAAGFVLQQTGISAGGGQGYSESAATPAQGGTGSIVLTNTNAGADITAQGSFIHASGGSLSRSVGNGGNGGDSLVVLNSAGGITLSNSFAGASGGNVNGSGGAPTDRGGAAGLTLRADGNILIEGGEGSAWGGSGPLGGNAAVNIFAGGNIQLEGGEGGVIRTHALPSAASSVVMASAGNLIINGGSVTSDGLVGLGGANILADQFVYVWGGTGVQVDASGSLTVNNSSMVGGNGIARITTGGNILVENSSMISGFPDVVLKVGGEIFLNTGGQISAGLPTTIYLTFPMLESGGYTVNGIPGLVFDGSTGFFAGGSGAILGTNLLVTYGGGAELVVPTDTLIVAMNDSIKPPDAEKKKDIFEDESSLKKKKDAPVCR